ncbi:hypothetical protein HHI36_023906 [Cryptolaemus montrouzieri]|uniref:Integrase catalytic domain-containing protein n=1 Tax=Cryptolaemus montrouzieri TaxID=559131 RepID=A0ABD2P377_9CUCU
MEFTSKTMKELNKMMSMKHKLTTPYHPQTNGALERTHLTLKDYFKCYVNKDQNNWDEFMNLATYCYNTNTQKSTQCTPYELVFGQKARIPNIITNPTEKPNYSELANDIAKKLKSSRAAAVENQINSKEKSKAHYDKTHHRTYTFKENDKVILCDSYAKNTSKRLCKNFKGPYKIIQIHNNQTATLEIGNKLKTYHFNQLKPFYELSDNANEQNDSDMDIDYDPSLDVPGPSNRQ